MSKLTKGLRRSASFIMSALISMSVFSIAAPLQASAVSYSEMSASPVETSVSVTDTASLWKVRSGYRSASMVGLSR